MSVGFGVIGANSFVANAAVMPAIKASRNGRLTAVASRSQAVPSEWSNLDVGTYDAVLDHPEVDVVYIPLPNGMHQEWTERAAAAGKHVLCEKPLASDAATAQAMANSCAAAGVMLAEAWMTPFDKRWAATIEMARRGLIGDVTRQHQRFTFTIGHDQSDNYRWDPAQGGGALLDVGIYCVGTAVELWGTDCVIDDASRVTSLSGVDATTIAELRWPAAAGSPSAEPRTAHVRCSFVEDEIQWSEFVGTTGRLMLTEAAFTSGNEWDHLIGRTHTDADSDMQRATITVDGDEVELEYFTTPEPLGDQTEHHLISEDLQIDPGDPYQGMVEAFADAVSGVREWPRPPQRSIELIQLLERIRDVATS
jgi:xylose dehydrogenase (NAD/NADP)